MFYSLPGAGVVRGAVHSRDLAPTKDPSYPPYLEVLRSRFIDRVRLIEKRSGIIQLLAPFYEDGDMVEIYIEKAGYNGKLTD